MAYRYRLGFLFPPTLGSPAVGLYQGELLCSLNSWLQGFERWLGQAWGLEGVEPFIGEAVPHWCLSSASRRAARKH